MQLPVFTISERLGEELVRDGGPQLQPEDLQLCEAMADFITRTGVLVVRACERALLATSSTAITSCPTMD